MNKNQPILSCHHLTKHYREFNPVVEVLHSINLTLYAGESVAILGQSGSGKTTLLHLLAGLDRPSSGEVIVAQQSIFKLSDSRLTQWRKTHIGFVYQYHYLLPELTALENVAMPLLISPHCSILESKDRAFKLLKDMKLEHRINHKPSALSGGERQRVAIARAIIHNPVLVLMDEPTGNLDHKTAQHIHELIMDIQSTLNITFVTVTHDQTFSKRMERQYYLQQGHLVSS